MLGTNEKKLRAGNAALTKNSGWFLISYDVIARGGHNGNAIGNKLHCMKKQERNQECTSGDYLFITIQGLFLDKIQFD